MSVISVIIILIGVLFIIVPVSISIKEAIDSARKPQTISDNPDVMDLRQRLDAEVLDNCEPEQEPAQQPAADSCLPSVPSAYDLLMDFLRDNACRPKDIMSDNPGMHFLEFKFQGGNYCADVSSENGSLRLYYNCIYRTSTSNADQLQRIANHFTDNLNMVKVISVFNEDVDWVQLNLRLDTLNAKSSDIHDFVTNAPILSHEIREYIFNDNKKASAEQTYDWHRVRYMSNELELLHQGEKIIANPQNPLTVGTILTTLFDSDDAISVSRLDIVSRSKMKVIKDALQIFNFNIMSTVYDFESKRPLRYTFLQVETDNFSYLLKPVIISESMQCLYLTLTVVQTPHNMSIVDNKTSALAPNTVSVMLAYDFSTEKNQHDEFRYIWLDMKDKIRKGQQSELTPEQQILSHLEYSPLSETVYRGYKYFLCRRYYDALVTLLPIYDQLKLTYDQDDDNSLFYRVCYLIGFCYCEIHQYDRAYFYLELAHYANQYGYAQEYINALVNAGDLRAFAEIDRMIDIVIKEIEKNEGHVPTDVQGEFYEFLLRRRGYLCIEYQYLDEAERIFVILLDYPDSENYARNELKHINKLRKSNIAN
ncbi:MAG: hypothetical protein IJ650_07170 [Paludibacteraceae bacterium]|nr:hypothetical protein [Paludibacteraceae bacterium]